MKNIPSVKTWNVTVVETGEKLSFDTISKKMVKIILNLDYPRLWGNTFKISPQKQTLARIVFGR